MTPCNRAAAGSSSCRSSVIAGSAGACFTLGRPMGRGMQQVQDRLYKEAAAAACRGRGILGYVIISPVEGATLRCRQFRARTIGQSAQQLYMSPP
jgi:hypothetical protein